MPKPLNIALVGSKFMGRAHSNAWLSVNKFFELPRDVVMRIVCALDAKETRAFARKWGWGRATTSYEDILDDETIELVDVGSPNHVHA